MNGRGAIDNLPNLLYKARKTNQVTSASRCRSLISYLLEKPNETPVFESEWTGSRFAF